MVFDLADKLSLVTKTMVASLLGTSGAPSGSIRPVLENHFTT